MLVSIALSTYNGERFLREQLDSLLDQRDVNFEIIAVDDGSRDGSTAILDEYSSRDARLKWQPNPHNMGPTRSFERAFSLCQGELIAPCDQDDVWAPEKLASLVAIMGHADLAYCDSTYIEADGASQGRRVSCHNRMMSGQAPVAFLFANTVSGHASLVRRSLLQASLPFPDGVYHDWWLALCAAGRNGVAYLDQPLVKFRRHDDAFSPMGRRRGMHRSHASSSQVWIEQRTALMRAYAETGFRDADVAGALAAAVTAAIAGHRLPLMRTLWRHRAQAPASMGHHTADGIKLMVRYWRKLRRIERAKSLSSANQVDTSGITEKAPRQKQL